MTDIIAAAAGREPADIVFKNVNIADVFNRRILRGDVAVCGEKIAGFGSYRGKREIDLNGSYIMPSFIDAHVHIESSMVTPSEYARSVVPLGVGGAVCDPHEIANVCGIDGIEFMMKNAENVPMDIRFMLPSCVPAASFEDAGAVFTAEDTEKFMSKYPFHGLAEMMNYPAVIAGDSEVLHKISTASLVDGHAPSVTGRALAAYAASGIRNDHECTCSEEMLEKISNGMYVFLREGTLAKDIEKLIGGVTQANLRRITFCTDDGSISDINIANCVKRAISLGMEPIDAITAATLNAAEAQKLERVGAIAPGYYANFIISDDIVPNNVKSVYYRGKLVAKDGKALFEAAAPEYSEAVFGTVRTGKITPEMLHSDFDSSIPVIEVAPSSIVTKKVFKTSADNLSRLAVIERHKNTGKIGRAWVCGYGIKGGAIASTIGHDSHNITVIGDNTDDMAKAVAALGKNGGIAVCANSGVTYLPLPIGGLMSDKPADEVIRGLDALHAAADSLCITRGIDPFMCLSFLPLPVIPELRLTDRGLFDVNEFKFI